MVVIPGSTSASVVVGRCGVRNSLGSHGLSLDRDPRSISFSPLDVNESA